MLENYSDNIIVLGTVGVSLFTYYYIVNYIYNYDNIKIYKFKDFDYKIITNEIKLINKTGVTLKIIGGKEYNKNMLNKIINNNEECKNLDFKKIFLDIYKYENDEVNFIGNSFVSLINESNGLFLHDSNNNLIFNLIDLESNIKENKYVFEIKAPNLYSLHKYIIENEYNKEIKYLS